MEVAAQRDTVRIDLAAGFAYDSTRTPQFKVSGLPSGSHLHAEASAGTLTLWADDDASADVTVTAHLEGVSVQATLPVRATTAWCAPRGAASDFFRPSGTIVYDVTHRTSRGIQPGGSETTQLTGTATWTLAATCRLGALRLEGSERIVGTRSRTLLRTQAGDTLEFVQEDSVAVDEVTAIDLVVEAFVPAAVGRFWDTSGAPALARFRDSDAGRTEFESDLRTGRHLWGEARGTLSHQGAPAEFERDVSFRDVTLGTIGRTITTMTRQD